MYIFISGSLSRRTRKVTRRIIYRQTAATRCEHLLTVLLLFFFIRFKNTAAAAVYYYMYYALDALLYYMRQRVLVPARVYYARVAIKRACVRVRVFVRMFVCMNANSYGLSNARTI
jgi:hypothetical protein